MTFLLTTRGGQRIIVERNPISGDTRSAASVVDPRAIRGGCGFLANTAGAVSVTLEGGHKIERVAS